MKKEIKEPSYLGLCPLCFLSKHLDFEVIDERLHEAHELHKTGIVTWQPTQGHDLFNIHKKSFELIKILKEKDIELKNVKEKFTSLKNKWWNKMYLYFNKKSL